MRDNLPKPAEDAAALAPDLSDKAARLDIPGGAADGKNHDDLKKGVATTTDGSTCGTASCRQSCNGDRSHSADDPCKGSTCGTASCRCRQGGGATGAAPPPPGGDALNQQLDLRAAGVLEANKELARHLKADKDQEVKLKQAEQIIPDGAIAGRRKAEPDKAPGMAGPAKPAQPFDERNREQFAGERLAKDRQMDALEKQRPALGPPPPPFVLREYAHQRSVARAETRSDFAETLCWRPALVLSDGNAQVAFDLSDSATTFQVSGYAYSLDGRLGAVTNTLESRKPFVLEPKLPLEVTASDKIDVPVTIANNNSTAQTVNLNVSPTGLKLITRTGEEQLTLAANERVRRIYRFQPDVPGREGKASLLLKGDAGPYNDTVERTLQVVPEGFPVVGSHSDVLEGVATSDVVMPDAWVNGTLKLRVHVYPSTLADLQKGLEMLLREPCGCFEQTSTSNYPNLLILDYLKESNQTKPEVEQKARTLLASGYQKLTSFECPKTGKNQKQGYEWFGAPRQRR